ncbi:DddA-like double-stranded DNA deaminase toxin [Kitasatospora sp. NPDC004614]|uniref:DddA-like double-stranded DNA deaminase toxin n=1 Tax=Kitasatospora sp. NPDC004614 TaxID=3364016 RepID=UPI00367C3171
MHRPAPSHRARVVRASSARTRRDMRVPRSGGDGHRNARGIVSITADVETKLAWEMRNEGIREMEIVINGSVCEGTDATKFLQVGCLNVAPLPLPEGYQLTVWHLDEKGDGSLVKTPTVLKGRGKPKK